MSEGGTGTRKSCQPWHIVKLVLAPIDSDRPPYWLSFAICSSLRGATSKGTAKESSAVASGEPGPDPQSAGCGRDLKSSNVLLTAEGVAKISDVRVATGLGAEERMSDATPRGFSYAPMRRPDGKGTPGTVSTCRSNPLVCSCHGTSAQLA